MCTMEILFDLQCMTITYKKYVVCVNISPYITYKTSLLSVLYLTSTGIHVQN